MVYMHIAPFYPERLQHKIREQKITDGKRRRKPVPIVSERDQRESELA